MEPLVEPLVESLSEPPVALLLGCLLGGLEECFGVVPECSLEGI